MENLILTATFSGPPTLLHLPHKFTNVKNPNAGFVLTRDAKRLNCVTFFPVSVGTFTLFLYQDFQGKQHWLIYGHFPRLHIGMPFSAQASVTREAGHHPATSHMSTNFQQRNAPANISVHSGRWYLQHLFSDNNSVLKALQINKSGIR